jgi:hypothetical protein
MHDIGASFEIWQSENGVQAIKRQTCNQGPKYQGKYHLIGTEVLHLLCGKLFDSGFWSQENQSMGFKSR